MKPLPVLNMQFDLVELIRLRKIIVLDKVFMISELIYEGVRLRL